MSLSKEEIYSRVRDTIADMFDLDPRRIERSPLLVDDLDFDSIDLLNMIIKLESILGKKVRPEQLEHVRTIADLVDALDLLLAE